MPRNPPTDAQIARIRAVAAAREALPTVADLMAETGLSERQVRSIMDGSRYRGRATEVLGSVPEVSFPVVRIPGDER